MEKLLIVVDYQNDFVVGSLKIEGAEKLEPRIAFLIKEFEKDGDDVVFTKDVHETDYLHTEEGRNLPVPHCIRGTGGEDIYPPIAALVGEHLVFEKSTFPSLKLAEYLSRREYREILLVGLDASLCVLSNAIMAKAAVPNAHIVVDTSATAASNEESLQIAYAQMKRIHIEVKDGTAEAKGIF